jgi:outer membrane lipoprotein-sorting protein
MIRKHGFFILGFLFLGLFISGCPKKIPEPVIIAKPPLENPVATLLDAFSPAESFQAKASIRINMVRNGQEMNFPALNGFILYQKPDRIRLLGYHPLGMGLFDALYRSGEFFLLIPLQKRVYTGEVSQFEDLIEKAGPIQISTEKVEGNQIPSRIRIDVVEKETHIDLRLREISMNSTLPEDSFQWVVPEGVEVKPLAELLKKRMR